MELEPLCPFPVATVIWEPQPGEQSLMVCVKVTFSLVHGRAAEVAPLQVPVDEDLYWDSSPSASLYAPSDFAPAKARTDILLVGHAYAPGAVPTESLLARMRVGRLSKALHVTGDRVWVSTREGLRPGPSKSFTKMPLRYERAALGPLNKIGVDVGPQRAQAGWPFPSIYIADESAQTKKSPPAHERAPGFGPIPPAWRAPMHKRSEASAHWAYRVRSLPGPAPDGFDFAFFNAAPLDQQVESLEAPVDIELENLSPTHPRLETQLPPIQPRAFRVSMRTGLSYEVPLRLDTLWIDCDRDLAVASWRGSAPVPSRDAQALGKLVITTDAHAESLSTRAAIKPSPASVADPAVPAPQAWRPMPSAQAADVTISLAQKLLLSPEVSVLPPGWASPNDGTTTLPIGSRVSFIDKPPLPFQPAGSNEAPVSPSQHVGSQALGATGAIESDSTGDGKAIVQGPSLTPVVLAPKTDNLYPAPQLAAVPPASPPPTLAAPKLVTAKPAAEGAATDGAPGEAEPGGISLRRGAAISAQLGDRKKPRAEVLRAHGLTEAAWMAVDRYWMAAIARDAERGSSAMLAVFDASYVASLEELRGPIRVEEYARLSVAVERGNVRPALTELQIQRPALMRIQRVWQKKLAADANLASRVAEAIESERKR